MKPIIEWIEQMDMPERIRAADNHRDYLINYPKYANKCVESIVVAIGVGFIWEKTSEGYYYWKEILNKYNKNEIIEPVINRYYQYLMDNNLINENAPSPNDWLKTQPNE